MNEAEVIDIARGRKHFGRRVMSRERADDWEFSLELRHFRCDFDTEGQPPSKLCLSTKPGGLILRRIYGDNVLSTNRCVGSGDRGHLPCAMPGMRVVRRLSSDVGTHPSSWA
jgi:hypothetical protein